MSQATADQKASDEEAIFEQEGFALCSYAIGLTDQIPDVSFLNVHPERFRAFLARFMENYGVEFKPNRAAPVSGKEGDAEAFRALLRQYIEEFGAEGARMCTEGKSIQE